jgi:hypothetical protein
MSAPDRALVFLLLACVLATVALTLVFVAFPELSDGDPSVWLVN